MRTVQVIGVGAGDPDHLTLQAIAALRRTDVFLVVDKGEPTADLAALRAELLARHVPGPYRVATMPDPERDRSQGLTGEAYADAVRAWQQRRAAHYARVLADELPEGGVGSFLVWGDPAIYDGTLRILEGLDLPLHVVSIPGISAVQALAAAHRLVLNRTGGAITVTTGRRLAREGMAGDDVVVMLDARCAFADLADSGVDIFWGAYLGTPDEVLVAGDLVAVKDEIKAVRARERARKGWIMDTYLLRRR
ncbi:MAG: precorrin-6A synthase (deacetylating) [Pseudonocardia sp.]|nr:precorrin-6A synthase (deacetylating) [Pseudonocardia sp.]